ncbi:lysophospholipase L1-like esterase [Hoeflea halophila]|uniref:Lysophospholipase L1-like esterase n=1 Tax=Hoeflea halophila TaxID=714899 RepID=A0A286IF28_9HYPH|nr:SGNH/GDSL hydrolase family protein [Hoeflea halophila]SOE18743.1 lysophospholipase L1-like esterase [Hoeflea halophila]
MKTVLCYGDSLTWGYDPRTRARHQLEDRWPTVLTASLGEGVHVVADGLNGRTTAFDDYTGDCDRNGARTLPTVLHTNAPLDLVIIMLGSNDMKPVLAGTAHAASKGMRRLLQLVKLHAWPVDDQEPPQILVVSPPPLVETADPDFAAMFEGGVAESAMLASFYADLADETGAGFFDAGSVAACSAIDGVHLDAKNTRAIGRGLAPVARLLLGH